MERSDNVIKSMKLLLAVKIAVTDPVFHETLIEWLAAVLNQVSILYESTTCRVRMKESE